MSFWSYGVHPTMNEHTAVTMGGMRRGDLRHTSTPNMASQPEAVLHFRGALRIISPMKNSHIIDCI